MGQTHHLPAALLDGATPVLPRPDFAFRRTRQKVFFIGFNKTATSALHMMMLASGVRALHGSGNGKLFGRRQAERDKVPNVAQHIASNIDADRDPIAGLGDYDAFLDMTVGPRDLCRKFKAFHHHHPSAIFVLHTREREAWIKSRIGHKKSVRETAQTLGVPEVEVPGHWRKDFDDHHAEVRSYFVDNPRFFEWNIVNKINILADFLNGCNVPADPAYFFRIRETGGLYFQPPLRAVLAPSDVPILSE